MLLHHPALHLSPTPSIAELTLNLLQRAVLIEMTFEEATLNVLLTTLGALQRILLALWPVILCDLLVGTCVAAVLAGEGLFHTLVGYMHSQRASLDLLATFPETSNAHVLTRDHVLRMTGSSMKRRHFKGWWNLTMKRKTVKSPAVLTAFPHTDVH